MSMDITLNFTKILEQAGLCVVLVVAPAVAGPQSNVQSESASTLSAGDRKFLNAAADGSMAEVELGKLALQNAGDAGVKEFGQRLVDDQPQGDFFRSGLHDRHGGGPQRGRRGFAKGE
jgi:predicted outer membrane protein